jgi:hypothetical protein
MAFPNEIFDQSIARQIEINQARTPTERFQAVCDLLDALRGRDPRLEPLRRERATTIANREKSRAELRRFLTTHRQGAPPRD